MMQCQEDELQKNVPKLIIVGDAATGKTNIIYTFVRDKPPNNIMPTVAVQYSSKVVNLDSINKVKVQIWDTAGQEAYRSLTMNHYRKVNGALIVFDVTNRTTFQHVAYWLQNLREKGNQDMQIGLIGHKIDCTRREVNTVEGEHLASKERLFYAETTIHDVSSIKKAFRMLITKIIQSQKRDEKVEVFRLDEVESESYTCSC